MVNGGTERLREMGTLEWTVLQGKPRGCPAPQSAKEGAEEMVSTFSQGLSGGSVGDVATELGSPTGKSAANPPKQSKPGDGNHCRGQVEAIIT